MVITKNLVVGSVQRSARTTSFRADLSNTLNPQIYRGSPTATFTRATTATVPDFEGIARTAKAGEARFKGARRVENLLTASEDFSNASWSNTNTTETTNTAVAPDGTTTADTITQSASNGTIQQAKVLDPENRAFVFSCWMKAESAQTSAIRLHNNDATESIEANCSVTTEWQRFSVVLVFSLAGKTSITSFVRPSAVGGPLQSVFVWGAQLEEVTGQSNQNPSDYVSTGVGTGAELDTEASAASPTNEADSAGSWTAFKTSGATITIDSVASSDAGETYDVSVTTSSDAVGGVSIDAETAFGLVVGKSYVVTVRLYHPAPATRSWGFSRSSDANISADVEANNALSCLTTDTTYTEKTAVITHDSTHRYWGWEKNGGGSNGGGVVFSTFSVKEAGHGANVDGVQYFPTLNGNTVSSNVVTEAAGAAITDVGVELITNGDFSDGTTGWSPAGNGVLTNVDGALRVTCTGGPVGYGSTPFTTVIGETYQVAGGIFREDAAGTFVLRKADTNTASVNVVNLIVTAIGEVLTTFVATATTTYIVCQVNNDGSWAEFDSISVKPVLRYSDAGGPFGYMAEAAATNLFTYSEEITNAAWTKTRVTATANVGTAPDGKNTAVKLTATDVNEAIIFQTVTIGAGDKVTVSTWAKKDVVDFTHFLLWDTTSNGARQWFDLANGAVASTASFGTGWTVANATIEAFPDGWFRCSATFNTATATNIESRIQLSRTDGSITVVVGDSIDIWGPQTEVGSFPTSYIPTTTTAVTRNADVLSYDDVGNISDTAGTAYCEASTDWSTAGATTKVALARTGTGGLIYTTSSEASTISRITDGLATSVSPAGTSRFNSPQAAASTWGATMSAYSPATLLPDLTPESYDGTLGSGDIGIGSLNDGTLPWGGTIRNVKIFSNEKSASEVAAL